MTIGIIRRDNTTALSFDSQGRHAQPSAASSLPFSLDSRLACFLPNVVPDASYFSHHGHLHEPLPPSIWLLSMSFAWRPLSIPDAVSEDPASLLT